MVISMFNLFKKTYQVTLDSVIERKDKQRSFKVIFITAYKLDVVIKEALRESDELSVEEGQKVIVRDIKQI